VAAGVTILEVAALQLRRDARAHKEGRQGVAVDLLRDVSFRMARGECAALMGASGTGKTTVLRAIAGLEPFSGGAIVVDGLHLVPFGHVHVRELQRRVGMVFQFHHLFAHMTALENVWLAPVHVMRLPRDAAEARARALLERLGVAHRADAMPHELSGGEAQRVAIARALAVNPPLLLMDEPTASLDPARRGELAATLRDLSADGTTLLIATHDADFARSCARRVLLLEGGRVTRDGTTAEVLS
jgi:ABC-type polar amino acid transport system ATPase subunit